MRISDWSADVCSSDLVRSVPGAGRGERMEIAGRFRRGGADRSEDMLAALHAFAHARLDGEYVVAGVADLEGAHLPRPRLRSERRRGGEECVSTGKYRWLS